MISSPLLSPHEKIVFKMLDKISSRTVFGAYIEIDITVTNSGENTLKSMKKLGQEVKHIIQKARVLKLKLERSSTQMSSCSFLQRS